jgi:Lipocalin-like domain
MKRLLLLGVIPVLFGVTAMRDLAGLNNRQTVDRQTLPDRFVGAWRLVRLEEPDADGRVHKADCTGMLVYTRDGHMSVQVIFKNPPAAPNAASVQYAQGGYEASFGTYEVDERTQTFTFHVEGALVRTLIGKDLPRAFELSGNQMIVKSTNPEEHWRVAWERY